MNRVSAWLMLMIATFVVSPPASSALTINSTFDPTVTSRADSAQWMSAWNYATSQFQSLYSDPITINITLNAGGGLGSSSPQLQPLGSFDSATSGYPAMKAALLADSTTANDASAYAHLPALDPTGGRWFGVTFANAKALGVHPANDPASDGSVTIGTGHTYAFDPNNRSVPGAFDFIGVAEHEISEIMGRIGFLGQGTAQFGHAFDSPIDLFGFSSPGTLNLDQNQQGVYFSIDGGVTSLRVYNNHTNGGDDKDWASGLIPPIDAFNAFGTAGIKEDMSPADLQSMDVMGYNLVPEPSSFALACFIFISLATGRQRRRDKANGSIPSRNNDSRPL